MHRTKPIFKYHTDPISSRVNLPKLSGSSFGRITRLAFLKVIPEVGIARDIKNLLFCSVNPITDIDKAAMRQEIVQYMHMVAARDRAGIESKFTVLNGLLENQHDPEIQGYLFFVRGITCFFKNIYEEAKTHFENIFDLNFKGETDLHGIAYMGLGLTLRSAGHLDEAVTNFSSAVDLLTKNETFKTFLAYCHHQLGEIHVAIGEYESAIRYFTNDFTLSREEENNLSSFRYHMGLGGCYLKMKDYDKSKFHFTRALELNGLPPPIISVIENDLGHLHLEIKEYDQAEKLFSSSITIREAHQLEDAACTSMTSLAEVYLQQHRISEAIELLNRCLTLVDKYQTQWKKIRVLSLLAMAHSLAENYKEAVRYYGQYHVLYDTIKGEQERKIFKFKNEQIERQKKIISEKHTQLAETLEEIKRLKVDRKATIFSWTTIIILVVISELFLDPLIEDYAHNNLLSLLVKVMIALLFKPLDGLYEKILWERAIKKNE